jgi:hypothetical protein
MPKPGEMLRPASLTSAWGGPLMVADLVAIKLSKPFRTSLLYRDPFGVRGGIAAFGIFLLIHTANHPKKIRKRRSLAALLKGLLIE